MSSSDSAHDNEEDKLSTWEVFEQSLLLLKKNGIKVCILRDDPEERLEWHEVDLLIHPDNFDSAKNLLNTLGWELIDTGSFIPLKRAMLFYLNGEFLKLDIHLSLVDGPYVYMDKDWILSTAKHHSYGFSVPSTDAWFLHVVLHTILGKEKISTKYIKRLKSILNEGIDEESILKQSKKYNLSSIVQSIIHDPIGQLSDPANVEQMRKKSKQKLLLSSVSNCGRWIKFKWMWSSGQILGMRNGLVIAVIGPDGAGKTTFLKELETALIKLEIPNRTVYMGPWEYPLLPSTVFLKYLGADPLDHIPDTDAETPMFLRISKLVKGLIKRYMYYINSLLEMWARYLFYVLPHLRIRRIVIADRYVYDLEVGFYNYIVHNSTKLRRLISKLTPRPNFVILLDNDAETIWSRKNEYPLDVIQVSLDKYRELASKYNFMIVRTDKPPQILVDIFLENNWREITRLRRD